MSIEKEILAQALMPIARLSIEWLCWVLGSGGWCIQTGWASLLY